MLLNQFFDLEFTRPLTLTECISKIPRYYQSNAVNKVADFLEEGYRRILIKSPTGTGKTFISKLVVLSQRVRQILNLDSKSKIRVLYIANKHRLNRQAAKEYNENKSVELIVHSAFSEIPSSIIEQGWDITVMDECHHEAMMSIQLLLDSLSNKPLFGFTADDTRGDGLLLKFERVVVAITEEDAARRGFTEKVGVNTIIDTGTVDKTELACKLLEKYHTHIGNAIVFFRTEQEVRKTHAFLQKKLNLSVSMLTTGSTEKEMDLALEQLSSGKIQFLINCQKIGEGIDAENITDALLFRHFLSKPEKKQYIGRAIRPDSPCAVWELINPLEDSVCAKQVVGLTKYERLIYIHDNKWHEKMIFGNDPTWGQMSKLRVCRDLIQNNDNTVINIPTYEHVKSGIAWTLQGQGIDTNTEPSENILKLATERQVRKDKSEQLTIQRRLHGQVITSQVSVFQKKKKNFAKNAA
jgi:DNA or RNA helicases of superfamily II